MSILQWASEAEVARGSEVVVQVVEGVEEVDSGAETLGEGLPDRQRGTTVPL